MNFNKDNDPTKHLPLQYGRWPRQISTSERLGHQFHFVYHDKGSDSIVVAT